MAKYWLLTVSPSADDLYDSIPTPVVYDAADDTEALLLALSTDIGDHAGDFDISNNVEDAKEYASAVFVIPATENEKGSEDETSWEDYDQMSDADKQQYCIGVLDDATSEPDFPLVFGIQNMDTGKFIFVSTTASVEYLLKDTFDAVMGVEGYYHNPSNEELARMGFPVPQPNETEDSYFAKFYDGIQPGFAKRFAELRAQLPK